MSVPSPFSIRRRKDTLEYFPSLRFTVGLGGSGPVAVRDACRQLERRLSPSPFFSSFELLMPLVEPFAAFPLPTSRSGGKGFLGIQFFRWYFFFFGFFLFFSVYFEQSPVISLFPI